MHNVNTRLTEIFIAIFAPDERLPSSATLMLVMTTIFISKMEGLPPTSDIKMIDVWLILCQLGPFSQVVLLTAMEFFRREVQEEKEVWEKDKSQCGELTNDNLEINTQFEVEDEPKPEEYSRIAPMEPLRDSFVPMLTVIGRFSVSDSWY